MYGICPRYVVLCYFYNIPISNNKSYPLKTYLTFKIGEKIEEIALEMLNGRKPPPLAIKIRDLYIVGSPDIVVHNKYIVECKSINKQTFQSLQEPIVRHTAQLSFYLWLASKYQHIGYSQHGAIVYIPKEEADEIIKVFPVSLSQGYANYFESVINQIKKGIQDRKLPIRACNSRTSLTARACKLVELCFKGVKNANKHTV